MFIEQVNPTVQSTPISVRNSQAEIDQLIVPVAEPVVRQVRLLINSEAEETALAHRDGAQQRLAASRETAAAAVRDAAEAESADAKAQVDAGQARAGSGWLGAILCLATAVCFFAEFALTLVTLPYILGLHQWSFLGVVLALAPTTAVLVLDKVVGRLVEDPFESIHQVSKAWCRRAVLATMVVFMFGLGVGNLWTVSLLADAREHATVLRREAERKPSRAMTERPGVSPVTEEADHRIAVKRAVWAVSVFVTLDGALFSLLALGELRRRRLYRKAQLKANEARAERGRRREQLANAQAQLSALEQEWNQIDERVTVWAARYREERLLQLEKALAKPPAARSGRETVTSILTGQQYKPLTRAANA